MKRRRIVPLSPEMILTWKLSCVAYLRQLYGKPIAELEAALMASGVLTPRKRLKGYLLLEPGMLVSEAYYLRAGLVKLYSVDARSGEEKILYFWEADSIIVLHRAFIEKLPNEEFYIEVMEDSELVSVSNFCMDDIYGEHTVAHELTQKILNLKTERRLLQTEILLMVDKKLRYCVFKQKFPELKGRLSNGEICGFIGITESTLTEARKLYPDEPDTA